MALINQNPAFNSQSKGIREFPITESSFLMNVHYDPNTLQAVVTMKGGSQYIYNMVFPMTIDQWMQSPSKGKFFAENIRGKFKMRSRIIDKTVGKPVGGPNGKPNRSRRHPRNGRG